MTSKSPTPVPPRAIPVPKTGAFAGSLVDVNHRQKHICVSHHFHLIPQLGNAPSIPAWKAGVITSSPLGHEKHRSFQYSKGANTPHTRCTLPVGVYAQTLFSQFLFYHSSIFFFSERHPLQRENPSTSRTSPL